MSTISTGRVGMSFGSGWNPDGFALTPQQYADRHDALFRGIEDVRRLWRGETIEARNGTGDAVRIRTYPSPVQRELPLWVTAASSPRTFERAGAIGANVLTHLLDHDVDELSEKVSAYRRQRAAHGHDPDAGQVTVMLHTFLGRDIPSVHAVVREPYCRYLKENIHLLKGLAVHRGSQVDVTKLSAADLDGFVGFLYDRFFSTRAFLGTVVRAAASSASPASGSTRSRACSTSVRLPTMCLRPFPACDLGRGQAQAAEVRSAASRRPSSRESCSMMPTRSAGRQSRLQAGRLRSAGRSWSQTGAASARPSSPS